MSKRKKWILITAGILLVVAMIATPTVLLLMTYSGEIAKEEEARQQELRFAFVERYGSGARLVEIVEPEKLYIFIWDEVSDEKTVRHFSLSIDGLFVELGQTKIEGE